LGQGSKRRDVSAATYERFELVQNGEYLSPQRLTIIAASKTPALTKGAVANAQRSTLEKPIFVLHFHENI
jgi:hypothetical protein